MPAVTEFQLSIMSTLLRSVQSLLRNKRAELPYSEVSGFQKNALNIFYNLLPCDYKDPDPLGNFPYNRNGGKYILHCICSTSFLRNTEPRFSEFIAFGGIKNFARQM